MCGGLHLWGRQVPTLRGGVMDFNPYEVDDFFGDRGGWFGGYSDPAGG